MKKEGGIIQMNIKEAKEIIYNMEIDGNSISCKNCVLEKRENCVVNGKDCQMEAIYTVLNELNKKDKVIDMMAEYIEECTGSCPNDMYNWKEIDCDKECEISMKKCWIKYFYKLVEGNIDKK